MGKHFLYFYSFSLDLLSDSDQPLPAADKDKAQTAFDVFCFLEQVFSFLKGLMNLSIRYKMMMFSWMTSSDYIMTLKYGLVSKKLDWASEKV